MELRYRPVEAVVLRYCSTGWVAASALSATRAFDAGGECAHYQLFALSVYFYLLMSDTF